MNTVMKQFSWLRELVDGIAKDVVEVATRLAEVGCESDFPEIVEQSVSPLRWALFHLEKAMDTKSAWYNHVVSEAERLRRNLSTLERRFLISEVARLEMQERVEFIEPDVNGSLKVLYLRWNQMRSWNTPIEDLRASFITLLDALEMAENESAELRIRRTLAVVPKKSRRPRRYISLEESRKNLSKDKPQKGKSKKEKKQREERRRSKAA